LIQQPGRLTCVTGLYVPLPRSNIVGLLWRKKDAPAEAETLPVVPLVPPVGTGTNKRLTATADSIGSAAARLLHDLCIECAPSPSGQPQVRAIRVGSM
jgi:hypothetical protein